MCSDTIECRSCFPCHPSVSRYIVDCVACMVLILYWRFCESLLYYGMDNVQLMHELTEIGYSRGSAKDDTCLHLGWTLWKVTLVNNTILVLLLLLYQPIGSWFWNGWNSRLEVNETLKILQFNYIKWCHFQVYNRMHICMALWSGLKSATTVRTTIHSEFLNFVRA